MSTANYISVIERYHDYRQTVHELMSSILASIGEDHLFDDKAIQCQAMERLGETYPFLDLLYILDAEGVQVSDNIAVHSKHLAAYSGKGKDRSQRPYYRLAQDTAGVVITDPYLSSASRKLCITAVSRWPLKNQGSHGYLLLDIDLVKTIEFIMGDTFRRRFQPFFKGVYSLIVVGLLIVVAALLYSAFKEIAHLFFGSTTEQDRHLKPFGVIIFLTLGLAVFDLGKTTLEEEPLMHKDIFRHSSTLRTITPFIAAILIAVSIEALLLMFKAALGDGQHLIACRVDDAGGGGFAGRPRLVRLSRRQSGGAVTRQPEKVRREQKMGCATSYCTARRQPGRIATITTTLANSQLEKGKTFNR